MALWSDKEDFDSDSVYVKKHHQGRGRMALPKFWRVFAGIAVALLLFTGLFATQRGHAGHIGSTKDKSVSNRVNGENNSASPHTCTKSFDGKRPIDQYVVMIDAGSSGSRVHVYHFNNCEQMPYLVKEEFKMLKPGLSSYPENPDQAAKSLDPLLKLAVENVPEELQKCTPVSVKATAGLRKLGDEKSSIILEAVRSHLKSEYPFVVDDVSIMGGDAEGVYAWVTTNYLLGSIGTPEKKPTAAVFDLGGGSTQIVFEPTWKDTSKKLMDGDHKYELSFAGRDFVLYQHSYLGYGLNEARDKINKLIMEGQKTTDNSGSYLNPCLPPSSNWTDKINGQEVSFHGPSVSAPLQCRGFAEKVLEKDAVCANPPCSFQGVHQPPLFEAFPVDSDMYVFSFFYDRTYPLGMPSTFSLDELRDLTNLVCAGEPAYPAFSAVEGAVETLKENPQWCTELSYMHALLRTGYDIKGPREVRIAKKIRGNELGWCLGASLPLLDIHQCAA